MARVWIAGMGFKRRLVGYLDRDLDCRRSCASGCDRRLRSICQRGSGWLCCQRLPYLQWTLCRSLVLDPRWIAASQYI